MDSRRQDGVSLSLGCCPAGESEVKFTLAGEQGHLRCLINRTVPGPRGAIFSRHTVVACTELILQSYDSVTVLRPWQGLIILEIILLASPM